MFKKNFTAIFSHYTIYNFEINLKLNIIIKLILNKSSIDFNVQTGFAVVVLKNWIFKSNIFLDKQKSYIKQFVKQEYYNKV